MHVTDLLIAVKSILSVGCKHLKQRNKDIPLQPRFSLSRLTKKLHTVLRMFRFVSFLSFTFQILHRKSFILLQFCSERAARDLELHHGISRSLLEACAFRGVGGLQAKDTQQVFLKLGLFNFDALNLLPLHFDFPRLHLSQFEGRKFFGKTFDFNR